MVYMKGDLSITYRSQLLNTMSIQLDIPAMNNDWTEATVIRAVNLSIKNTLKPRNILTKLSIPK